MNNSILITDNSILIAVKLVLVYLVGVMLGWLSRSLWEDRKRGRE